MLAMENSLAPNTPIIPSRTKFELSFLMWFDRRKKNSLSYYILEHQKSVTGGEINVENCAFPVAG